MGGQLTRFSSFGSDPLTGNPEHQRRRDAIFEAQFDIDAVFGSIVNGQDAQFRLGVKNFKKHACMTTRSSRSIKLMVTKKILTIFIPLVPDIKT